MNPTIRIFALLFSLLAATFASGSDYPAPTELDYTIHDFKFTSGETLPDLRLHYRALGKPETDAQGKTTNAVLIMHGTTGSGAQFIRPEFAGELFGKDQPLDATKFFIVLPDGIGHGKSSKPSDALHAKFPRYGYRDMIEAQYRLLTHGRANAVGVFADADFRAQSCVASNGYRHDSQRSGLERWRVQNTTAEPAQRGGDALVHEQQSGLAPKGRAHTREDR